MYSRSPTVGNPIASILTSSVWGIPALVVLSPVSNLLGFAINPRPLSSSFLWYILKKKGNPKKELLRAYG